MKRLFKNFLRLIVIFKESEREGKEMSLQNGAIKKQVDADLVLNLDK